MWFVIDLLAVLLVGAVILGGLYFLQHTFHEVFTAQPSPIELFTGTAVLLINATAILAISLSMTLLHSFYLVDEDKPFKYFGIVALLLILADGAVIAFTMHQFFNNLAGLQQHLLLYLTIHGISVIATVYYSVMLKSELLLGLYMQTIHAGIATLDDIALRGHPDLARERSWLGKFREYREAELAEFNRRYAEHEDHVRERVSGE